MPSLSNIAQSVFIGNSSVWNFLNYAVNRPIGGTGGVLGLAVRNDYVAKSLNNNRTKGGLWGRRVENGEIGNSSAIYIIDRTEGGDSKIVDRQNLSELFIGDGYAPENRQYENGRRFITTDEFTQLNNYIYETYYKSAPYWRGSEYGVEPDTSETSFEYNVGEKHTVPDNVSLNVNFTAGSFFLRRRFDNYQFYQESDRGAAVESLGTEINVSDGTSVLLNNSEYGSMLIRRTNQLFRNAKIESMINRFHSSQFRPGEMDSSFDAQFGISRGRNLIRADYEGSTAGDGSSGYDNPYCRVWTAHHQYSRLKDRIRPFMENGEFVDIEGTQRNYGNLRPNDGAKRLSKYSVLKPNGYLKVSPSFDSTKTEGNQRGYEDNIKNYMFSIENLAWRDIVENRTANVLSKEQRGPNNGRIMWFPPYGLKFTENVNVNWTPNTFIGRGEEILTYVSTVRTGTLDFILLMDHPAVMNKWRGTSQEVDDKERKQRDLLRFFAGCGDLNDAITPAKEEKDEPVQVEEPSREPRPVRHTRDIAYVIFFPNNLSGTGSVADKDDSEIYDVMRLYNTTDIATELQDEEYDEQILQEWNRESKGEDFSKYAEKVRGTIFGGDENVEINFWNNLEGITDEFTGDEIFGVNAHTCEIMGIEVGGCASSHGYEDYNMDLCDKRRDYMVRLLKENAVAMDPTEVTYTENGGKIVEVSNVDGRADVNAIDAKLARAAYAIIHLAWNENNKPSSDIPEDGMMISNSPVDTVVGAAGAGENGANIVATTEDLSEEYTYDNEYLYFSELKANSPMAYRNLVDKIRYFSPAYHSITPEGFNARLTFLQQCTRQGPTYSVSGGQVETDSSDYLKYAGNLSFGRAPYCVLRIGDFFNTKICIESMSISYDNGNGVQWDLNPEGAGVQPMFANVSITFKFFGGQDISGPIERLQNAVTSNYYANASVYDRRADTDKFYYDVWEGQEKEKNNSSRQS